MTRAVELRPDSFGARAALARVLVVAGDAAEAVRHADAALQLNPQSSVPYSVRGVARARLGRLTEAQSDYERALALASRDHERQDVYLGRARLHALAGRPAEALADFQRADTLSPSRFSRSGPAWLTLETSDLVGAEAARGRFLQVSAKQEEFDGSYHYAWAWAYLRAGYSDRAYERMERAFAANKEAVGAGHGAVAEAMTPALHHLRALVHRERGNLAAARQDLDTVLAKVPEYAPVIGTRGLVRRSQGDEAGTARDLALFRNAAGGPGKEPVEYLIVLLTGPGPWRWHEDAARVWMELGEPAQALPHYDAALVKWPFRVELWADRAGAYRQLGQLERSLADARKAVGLGPRAPQAYPARGRVLAVLGQTAEARRDFEHARALGGGGQLETVARAELEALP